MIISFNQAHSLSASLEKFNRSPRYNVESDLKVDPAFVNYNSYKGVNEEAKRPSWMAVGDNFMLLSVYKDVSIGQEVDRIDISLRIGQ